MDNGVKNVDKNLYLAPMEGITGPVYRNALHKYFGGADFYITPFISPTQNKVLTHRDLEDVLPQNNEGLNVTPQILANNAELFVKTAQALKEYGYNEVNLNLGCPSGTVVSKEKGSGLLANLDRLDEFLDGIYNEVNGKMGMDISVKTRIGRDDTDEFHSLLIIFNEYPIKLLTVHPRIQKELYKGKCHLDIFADAVKNSKNKLCYNGDINTIDDFNRISGMFGGVNDFMIGRGVLKKPNLFEMIRQSDNFQEYDTMTASDIMKNCSSEEKARNIMKNCSSEEIESHMLKGNDYAENIINTIKIENMEDSCKRGQDYSVNDDVLYKKKLRDFHDEIYAGYEELLSGERNVLFKMKELWFYMGDNFENAGKALKLVKKAQKKEAYFAAVDRVFDCELAQTNVTKNNY